MSHNNKEVVISFKIDRALAQELETVPNRSAFIRKALSLALFEHCPICLGSGMLPRSQQQHWREFLNSHKIIECPDCHSRYPICSNARSLPESQDN